MFLLLSKYPLITFYEIYYLLVVKNVKCEE